MAPSSSFTERDTAVALLEHRIDQLPGFEVLGHSRPAGALVLVLDVRETGFSAAQVARTVRMLGGVRLDVRDRHLLTVTFTREDDWADAGTRLLFGLSHASFAPRATASAAATHERISRRELAGASR
jgi:hypothetical protein